jgi:hypothetical protein
VAEPAHLARCPDGAGDFHLVVADAPRQDTVLRMITERLGAHGLTLVEASTPLTDATAHRATPAVRLALPRLPEP